LLKNVIKKLGAVTTAPKERVDNLSTRCEAFEKAMIFSRFWSVGVQRYDRTKSGKKRQIAGDIRCITCYYKMYRLLILLFAFYLPVAVARLSRQSARCRVKRHRKRSSAYQNIPKRRITARMIRIQTQVLLLQQRLFPQSIYLPPSLIS